MIKEALELLVDLGRKSKEARLLDLPGHRAALVRGDDIELYDKDRQPRNVRVETLASFVRWVKSIGMGRDVQILVGDEQVIAFVDIEDHIVDVCILPLEKSAALQWLTIWADQPLSVTEVVRGLRTALDGAFEKSYLPTFRRIDFSRMKSSAIKVTHTGESMGRSVEKQAQSAEGEIPDVLAFDVSAYSIDVAFAKYKMRYAVDVLCDTERIAITPIGDGVDRAIYGAKAELVAWLDTALPDCMVLSGA